MYKYLTVAFVALLSVCSIQSNAVAQANTDTETYKEIEQYEKERTIEVVDEDKNASETRNVGVGLLASALPSMEAISDNSVSADNNTIKKLGDEVTDPDKVKSEKKKFQDIPELGVENANEFFEADEKQSGSSSAAGGQCSTPGTAVY